MKRILRLALVLLFLAGLGVLPFKGREAADLLPVKTVVVTRSGRTYTVDVGAGVKAVGRTLAEALRRLREEVTGEVFFGTAEQVVIADESEEAAEAVTEQEEFRPAAGIYRTTEADPDAEALGDYLSTHSSNTTILLVRARLRAGQPPRIPLIVPADGGYRVYE
jgi:arylamine N-acetyltransferase